MGERVDIGPAGQIELDPDGQKLETGLCQLLTPFALQHGVEFLS